MPIYAYRCRNGHEFEAFQSMSEDPISRCGECGAPVERLFHPVAVHFKGSGFYSTDYGARTDGASDEAGKDAGKKDAAKKDSAKAETSGRSESSGGSGEKGDGGKTKAGSSGE